MNDFYGGRGEGEGASRREPKNWRTTTKKKKMRETHGDLSDRTALENCGFELACTISRCLLRPSACGAERQEGVLAIEIAGGSRGGACIQAHVERDSPP